MYQGFSRSLKRFAVSYEVEGFYVSLEIDQAYWVHVMQLPVFDLIWQPYLLILAVSFSPAIVNNAIWKKNAAPTAIPTTRNITE